ncbi:MAG: hypothetical protein NUW37_05240 [Planctomycetes bacterium]|nr:hypothetical protein [Planctomycetota bacterium]
MNAFKFHSVVQEGGVVEVPTVPLPKGSRIEIIILPEDESLDLSKASESSLDFWDNPVDDAVWNDA